MYDNCGFYRSDNHGDLHRDYQFLTKEMSDKFVDDAVETIMTIIIPMIGAEKKPA